MRLSFVNIEVTITELLKNSDWAGLAAEGDRGNIAPSPVAIRRRFLLRRTDILRNKFGRGDR